MSAAEVATALRGSRNGDGFLCRCPVPGHGRRRGDCSPSLSIKDGEKGLLVRCFAGCDSRDVLDELRRRGLIGDQARRDRPAISHQTFTPPNPEPDEKALALWRSAIPAQGTLAKHYLHWRGITLAIPQSIRFLPYAEYLPRIGFAAMVAAVQRPDRRIIAVQLTFLHPDGNGKAPVAAPRKTVGALGSGAVRLGPAGEILSIAEGTETALSAMQIFGVPCWVALGAGRMHNVVIPDPVRELHVFADSDEPGRAAADRVIAGNAHRKVVVHYPRGGDWNDALARGERAA